MRMRTGVAVLALVGLLAACGDDGGTAATTTTEASSTTTTTAAPTTTAATTTTAAEPSSDALPDGVSFGYLTKVTIGDTTATGTFDLAYLFTGDAAVQAAKDDGAELDTDYYIRNQNPRLREVPIDPHAVVTDIDYDHCCDGKSTNIADFATTIDHPTPVNITMAGGVATKVEELYFP